MNSQKLVRVQDITNVLSMWAPPALSEDWDNVGLLVGDPEQPVRQVLVAMDIDGPVLTEAEAKGVDLIVTHHPPLLRPIRSLTMGDVTSRYLIRLVRAGIAVYTAHTNLDRAAGGVNDTLASRLSLQDVQPLQKGDTPGFGRWGNLPEPMRLDELGRRVKAALGAPFVLVAGDEGRVCRAVAVCGGSGGSFIRDAVRCGVDVYVTGDVKYHDVQWAVAEGLAIIDAGHYATEYPVLEEIRRRLQAVFAGSGVNIEIAQHAQQFRSFWKVM